MRWTDKHGVRWRIRRHRLAGQRRIKPEWAFDLMPDGSMDDPISMALAVPGMLVLAVVLPIWLAEWLIRLLLTPFAALLRLTGLVPYRVELVRDRTRGESAHTPRGYRELRRTLTALREGRS